MVTRNPHTNNCLYAGWYGLLLGCELIPNMLLLGPGRLKSTSTEGLYPVNDLLLEYINLKHNEFVLPSQSWGGVERGGGGGRG